MNLLTTSRVTLQESVFTFTSDGDLHGVPAILQRFSKALTFFLNGASLTPLTLGRWDETKSSRTSRATETSLLTIPSLRGRFLEKKFPRIWRPPQVRLQTALRLPHKDLLQNNLPKSLPKHLLSLHQRLQTELSKNRLQRHRYSSLTRSLCRARFRTTSFM